MTISVDVLTNSVVVAAPEPLLTEVEQLVRSIDQTALDSSNQVIVTKRVHVNPNVLQSAVRVMMGEQVQFGGISGSSRTGTSSGRTPTSTSRGSDDARRAMFMEIMRQRMQGGGRGGPPGFGGSTGRGGTSGMRGGGRGSTGGGRGSTGGGRGSTGGRGGRGG